jgi:hypothetical protein
MVTLSEGYQEEPMEFTSPAGHINLRETADPETGLKPNGTAWFPVSAAVPGKGIGRMKNVHFSGLKRDSGLTCQLSRERNQQHPGD